MYNVNEPVATKAGIISEIKGEVGFAADVTNERSHERVSLDDVLVNELDYPGGAVVNIFNRNAAPSRQSWMKSTEVAASDSSGTQSLFRNPWINHCWDLSLLCSHRVSKDTQDGPGQPMHYL